MATKEFVVLFLIGLCACVVADTCPPKEDLPMGCQCLKHLWHRADHTITKCNGKQTESSIEDLKTSLQKSFSGKTNVQLEFDGFGKNPVTPQESSIPSRMFEGLDIKQLSFMNNYVTRWTEEKGGPAFVGLENSLEEIKIWDSIHIPKPSPDYDEVKTPLMTLGHLLKLEELDFYNNKIHYLGDDWFGKSGSPIERIIMDSCLIEIIGDHAFSTLDNLWNLNMRRNYIVSVKRSMFPNPATNLKILALSNNRIEDLPDDMFTNMPALRTVDLRENKLQTLKESIWRPIWSNLDELEIAYNVIECNELTEWIFKVSQPKSLRGQCYTRDEDAPGIITEIDLVDLIDEKQGKGKY